MDVCVDSLEKPARCARQDRYTDGHCSPQHEPYTQDTIRIGITMHNRQTRIETTRLGGSGPLSYTYLHLHSFVGVHTETITRAFP